MNNEELSPSDELASAYLDCELEATERAAAEADPAVMEAVASLTRVRTALGEIAPVSPSTKTAAIAAALAEFDALRAEASSPSPASTATVISMQGRRQRALRVLTRVAAVLVVGVVAVAALKAGTGNNESKSSSAALPASATEQPQLKIAAETAAAAATAAPAGTAAAGGIADNASAVPPRIDSDQALQDYAASLVSAAPAPQVAATQTSAAAAAATSGGFAALACLSSEQIPLGPIVFEGIPAFAVRNPASNAVQAVAETDCRVLAEVPTPP